MPSLDGRNSCVGELKDSSIPVVLRGFEIIDLKTAQDKYPAGEAYATK